MYGWLCEEHLQCIGLYYVQVVAKMAWATFRDDCVEREAMV